MSEENGQQPQVNPNVFQYEIAGATRYADPLKVRRILLQNTMGKCWGIVQKINKLSKDIEEIRTKYDALQADLDANPTTADEIKVMGEIQATRAEGKQVTLKFEEYPRIERLSLFEVHIGSMCNQQAELEGILSQASMEAFELEPFNPENATGTTELDAIQLLKLFLTYVEGKGERLGI